MQFRRLVSKLDSSVNFVSDFGKSLIECRYVRRHDNYISVYLSSHNGCTMRCKFCWLTNTSQISFKHCDIQIYKAQFNEVLKYAKTIDGKSSVGVHININLMARGEPLANKYLIKNYPDFYETMETCINTYNYKSLKINLSTIMPYTIYDRNLVSIFGCYPVHIYYSLYSFNPHFRRKWMPNAIEPNHALQKLRELAELDNPITIHFALIKGENDKLEEVKELAKKVDSYKFPYIKFNVVRFNPHESLQYEETDPERMDEIFSILNGVSKNDNESYVIGNNSRVVPRIGKDVYASCGMFISKE